MHGKIIISTKIKNKLRTFEAQIVQKLKNNEGWPKFTGSYKKKRVTFICNAIIGFQGNCPQ